MKHISIGRQPILDAKSNLCSYEILYQGSEVVLSRYSSASVINSVLNKFGTVALLGDRRAFVKIDQKFLLHDIIFSIPSEFFIFSIIESVEINDRVIERIEQLYDKGYLLAIDKLTLNRESMQKYEPIRKKVSFIKINIQENTTDECVDAIRKLKADGITIVADNVKTLHQFEQAKLLGCEWFQGYFFAEPIILENAKYEPSQMSVLKLYNLLMMDTNIDEVTKEFENNHEITVQLLQFINSGAFHFRKKISSIHHILTLVGRIPLGQWLMLMIYSKSVSNDGKSPLMLMVKNRTRLMEEIVKLINPNAGSNIIGEAYFVGVLSLMDTVFGMELSLILEHMHISDEVKEAVLYEKGMFGEVFTLVKDLESFKVGAGAEFEKKHGLQNGAIASLVVKCIEDVNEFEKPNAA